MEIKEFRSQSTNEKRKKKSEGYSWKLREFLENRAAICLCAFCLAAVLTMILGIVVFQIPLLTVVLVLLIETGMAACLHNLPVWLHVVVLVAQILLGGLVSQVVFMILAVLCYGLVIFTLKFEAEKSK